MTINFVPLIIIFNFLINNSFNRFIQIPEKKTFVRVNEYHYSKRQKKKQREAFSKKKTCAREMTEIRFHVNEFCLKQSNFFFFFSFRSFSLWLNKLHNMYTKTVFFVQKGLAIQKWYQICRMKSSFIWEVSFIIIDIVTEAFLQYKSQFICQAISFYGVES